VLDPSPAVVALEVEGFGFLAFDLSSALQRLFGRCGFDCRLGPIGFAVKMSQKTTRRLGSLLRVGLQLGNQLAELIERASR
jgi:hypothetical protein